MMVLLALLPIKTLRAAELLTRVADVRQQTVEPSDKPCRIRGVVTFRAGNGSVTIQDDSGGIWIDFPDSRKRGIWRGKDSVAYELREGQEVEIVGRSATGGYAPTILPETLQILGEKPLPTPATMIPSRFFSGTEDCQRIEARGVVQRLSSWSGGWILSIDANPGRFSARVSKEVIGNPADLVDSEVCLRGVALTRFNLRGEATGSWMVTRVPGDLVVEKLPPPPDAVPLVKLDRLLPFRAAPIGPHRVRVEGTVSYSLPGNFVYLQDQGGAVQVETESDLELKPGDRVEAAGFVDISRFIGTLGDATVRKIGVGDPPVAVRISPSEILATHRDARGSRMFQDYDGQLIRCRAVLLAVESDKAENTSRILTLEQTRTAEYDNYTFRARLQHPEAPFLDSLKPGSDLELTGLVRLEFAPEKLHDPSGRSIPASLGLVLRDRNDVVVLKEPSWWTARHSKTLLSAALLTLAAAVAWNLQLKSQVRKKTQALLREKNARRDAALEFRTTMRERNRLAANLHDTLPQTMSAISLQLDATDFALRQRGIDSMPPLEMVRTMVNFAEKELRSAVWEMRSFSLRGRSFSEALQDMAQRTGGGHSARISMHVDGPFEGIPDFVSGNLLLIVQEALRNALQHAQPTSISVTIRTKAPGAPIHLEFVDDGTGFAPGSQKGPEQGHFGIVGMMERAERLGGTLWVDSTPGKGTRIVAQIRQDANDQDLADREVLPDTTIPHSVAEK